MNAHLAERLNAAGVSLYVNPDPSLTPVVIKGPLPPGVSLDGTGGDVREAATGERAFFDTHDRRWYKVGSGGLPFTP